MNAFLLDLWHDLRSKRLLPVAILLLAGAVAVPLLLLKHGSDEPAPPAPAATAANEPDAAKVVAAADQKSLRDSALRVFHSKDPFKARAKLKALASASGLAPNSASAPATSSSTAQNSGGSRASSSVGGTSASAEQPASGGQTTGGGGGGSSTGGGESPSKVTVKRYAYVLDLHFGRNGHVRSHRDVQKLAMLPSEDSPLLIFLGVDAGGDNGVFLVDSSLKTTGEGSCKPSTAECEVLSLGPGSEQYFTDEDGDSYTLRVDEIRKVSLSKSAHASAHGRRRGARASASRAQHRPLRRFSPLLTDLVTVASTTPDHSSDHSNAR